MFLDPAQGWVNANVDGPKVHLARERLDLVSRWLTADDNDGYYARQNIDLAAVASGPLAAVDMVCDIKADALQGWPFGCNTVDEVLARQMVEHFSAPEFRRFMGHADYAVKPGGILRIDVPDYEATLAEFRETSDDTRRRLLHRHLVGPRAGERGYHCVGYTRKALRDIVEEHGFQFVEEEPPLKGRIYPAFCLRWRKPLVSEIDPIPWQRLLSGVEIAASARCLEVGPGSRRFWQRANAILDIVDRGADDRPPLSMFVKGDICARTPFADKEFDVVLISHVMEHVKDPEAAARELTRIAKSGIMECPHPFKEMLFGFEGAGHDHTEYAGHEWWVFPPARGRNAVRFERPDERMMSALKDKEMSAAMHRILRLGPQLGADGQTIRRWFTRGQEYLNTVHRWEGELRVEVVA